MPTELTTVLEPLDIPFGWAPRALIEDPNISWRAKGLYTYLNSRPPGWQINPKDLTARSSEGRDATRNAVRELRDAGWLVISRRREGGKFAGRAWTLIASLQAVDNPSLEPRPENPAVVHSPRPEKPPPGNPRHSKKNSSKKNTTLSVATQPATAVEEITPGGPDASQPPSSTHPASGPPIPPDRLSAKALLAGGRQLIAARFLPAVRDLRLGGVPGFSEGREVTICEQLLQKGYRPADIDLAIDGAIALRAVGTLDWLPPDKPATLRCLYNTRKGATPFFNYCVNYARKRHEARNGNGRSTQRTTRSVPVPITIQLESRSADGRHVTEP